MRGLSCFRHELVLVCVIAISVLLSPLVVEAAEEVSGVSGTAGDDTLDQSSPVAVTIDETFGLSGLYDYQAIGIDALAGNDSIGSLGGGSVTASTDLTAYTILLGLGVHMAASGTGIAGGADNDTMIAGAPVSVTSSAFNNTAKASPFFEQVVPSIPGFDATAQSAGLAGGMGTDDLTSNAPVSVLAIADNNLFQLTLTPVELPADVFGLGLTPVTADALAVGLSVDGGASSCDILLQDCTTDPNAGLQSLASNDVLEVDAKATVSATDVSATLGGTSRSDTSLQARATGAGFLGGITNDTIANNASLDVDAFARASSNGVEIVADALPLPVPPAEMLEFFGVPIAESDVIAGARAIGIDAGEGNDTINNSGTAGRIGTGPDHSLDDLVDNLAGKKPVDITKFITDSVLELLSPSDTYCNDTSSRDVCALARVDTFDLSLDFPFPADTGPGLGPASMGGFINIVPIFSEIFSEGGEEPSFAEIATRSFATVTGISGGEGRDAITNASPFAIESYAYATSSSFSVTLAEVGIEELFPLAVAFSDGRIAARADAFGLAGGSGEDWIGNTDTLDVLSTARARSISLSLDAAFGAEGISADLGMVEASTVGEAHATAIDGMGGRDEISNSGTAGSKAYSEISTSAIAISASAVGTGVVGDASLLAAESIATADSTGIDGGKQESGPKGDGDVITNVGIVEADAESNALSKSTAVTVAFAKEGVAIGASITKADTTAEAGAMGIRSDAGDDVIDNGKVDTPPPLAGEVHADAKATAVSDAVALALTGAYKGAALGFSMANANTEARAISIAIDSGAGNDTIDVYGVGSILTSSATADSTANSVAITVAIAPVSGGAALTEAGSLSAATAFGISAGDGVDAIANEGLIDVDANAATHAKSISVNFDLFGAGISDVASTALAYASGIDGGTGWSVLANEGQINVDANAGIDSVGAGANLVGWANADLLLYAQAEAYGMTVGNGGGEGPAENLITNAEGASIDVTASVNSDADDYGINGGGSTKVNAGSTTEAIASGVLGGARRDVVTNSGGLAAAAESVNSAISFVFTGGGIQMIDVDISAGATATGIDAGEGTNVITNASTGSIAVHAQAENLAGSVGAGILGFNFNSADASAVTLASGILSGNEVDHISNEGLIDVTANVFNDAGAGAIGLFSFSITQNLSSATLEGINAGGGDDHISNAGTVAVGQVVGTPPPDKCLHPSISCARAATFGLDLVGLGLADLGAQATLTGIAGGGGADTIVNNKDASLTVGDHDDWMVFTETDSLAASLVTILELNLAFGTADVASMGMDGGEGDDLISNAGALTVDARSAADVYAEIEIELVGLTTSHAVANATAVATAGGIAGGGGDDELDNNGFLTVRSKAKTYPHSVTEAGISGADSTVESVSDAIAIGMLADTGSNMVSNLGEGVIDVDAFGAADASTDTTTGSFVKAESTKNDILIKSTAWGMRTGTGDDILSNSGDMTVTARTGEGLSMKAFAEDVAEVGPEIPKNDPDLPSVATPGLRTIATAIGMDAGEGRDQVTNTAALEVNAFSNAWGMAYNDSSDITRDNSADISVLSKASATGLRGEGESSLFDNSGAVKVTARSTGWSNASSDSATKADSDSWLRADVVASGVQADGYAVINNSHIDNQHPGTIDVVSEALLIARAAAYEGGGYWGVARASTIGVARANGLLVGDSGSLINNSGTLTVNARVAEGDVGVPAYAYLAVVPTADNASSSNTRAEAFATGILAGRGRNEITNRGTLIVSADVHNPTKADVTSDDYSLARAAASASGVGIQAGVGDGAAPGNLIRNSGGITVTATSAVSAIVGDADVHLAEATASASAVGILTGKGDDVIYNHDTGSITTSITAREQGGLIVDSAGTAISAGAGNDIVYLEGDSRAEGRILLDEGDDLLSFRDAASVIWSESGAISAGLVDGGSGVDTLRIEDRNSFTIAPPAAMENLEVDQGQLHIEGDYGLPAAGRLQVAIYDAGVGERGYGQLVVDGNATLDGTLSIVALPRIYRDGEQFDLMTAGSIDPASDFGVVNLPDPTPLLTLSLVDPRPLDRIVRAETSVSPFGTVAGNPLQISIAQLLDRLAPTATGELAALLGTFQLTPASGMNNAFSSLSPDSYQALSHMTFANSLDFMHDLQSHMLGLRRPMIEGEFTGLSDSSYAYAYAGDDLAAVGAPASPAGVATSNRNLSLRAYRASGSLGASQGHVGLDYDSWAIALSPEIVQPNYLAGLSLGYVHTDVDYSNGMGAAKISGPQAALFGSIYSESSYLEAALAYSKQDYENARNVMIGPLQATARSDHDGGVLQGYVGAGHILDRGVWWTVQPFAALNYTQIDEDGFEESGAGVANLKVPAATTESLVGEAGVRLSRQVQTGKGMLDLGLSLSAEHDFGIDDRRITASLSGVPGSSFTIEDRDLQDNTAVLGAGIGFRRKNTSVSLRYRGRFNGDFDSHALMASLRYEF